MWLAAAVAIVVGVVLPWNRGCAPLVAFNVAAILAIGVSLVLGRTERTFWRVNSHVVAGLTLWAMQSILLLVWMVYLFPAADVVSALRITLPQPFYCVRSPLDVVVVVTGILSSLLLGGRFSRLLRCLVVLP